MLAARLGAERLPERTGELLLTAVATTGMVAAELGTAVWAGGGDTAAGTTAGGTTVAAASTAAAGGAATAGLAAAGRGLAASAVGFAGATTPGAPAARAGAATGAFAAGSAGVLLPWGLGSGGVEEAMAGENRTQKDKLGAGPLGLIRPATSGR